MKRRRRQSAVKGRFSAMLISAAVHVAVLIAAGTFVAVTVVQRQEARFEGRQVSRPRMQLQRLQVPQRARMERQAPQMSQRVTAQDVSTRSVEFQMPEIAGLGGGISVDMSGAGFAGSLGFASPQLNLFGLRSQGEKVVFLLDTNRQMLIDEVGGIPAYEIIKEELLSMIGRLPATTLFNVIVFAERWVPARAFSRELVPATSDYVEQVQDWLRPLNAHRDRIGFATLGSEGYEVEFERMVPIPNTQGGWLAGLSWALRHGADAVYWMGANDEVNWIHQRLYQEARRGRPIDPISGQPEEYRGRDFSTFPGGEERWRQLVEQAQKMHEEENARRRAAGRPERVLGSFGGEFVLVGAYFPGVPIPPLKSLAVAYNFTAQDVIEYIEGMLRKHGETDRRSAAMGLRGRHRFSFNVIHFVPADGSRPPPERVGGVPRRMNGEFVQIRGLEAVRSAASTGR